MSAVREIALRKRRLQAAFERAKAIGGEQGSEELKADYARHLCVLVSGFIERAVAEIILAYASGKAPAPLQSYLEANLKRLTNVDKDRLLQVVGSLDARWRTELEEYVVDERQAAINSIVGLRNDIAHGGGTSVGLLQVERYWATAQEIIEKVEQLILGDPRPLQGRKRARN